MRKSISLVVPTLAVSMLLAACGSSSSSSKSSAESSTQPASTASGASSAVVKTSSNGTILVDAQGMTLYHLSAEQNGKFICTSSECLGVWHPLTVAAGTTPTGASSLAVVKRPDGSQQVTYNGMPLYTFVQDTKEGDVKGQGIKDVGTWSAVTISSSSASAPATTTTSSTPAPKGGGYAY